VCVLSTIDSAQYYAIHQTTRFKLVTSGRKVLGCSAFGRLVLYLGCKTRCIIVVFALEEDAFMPQAKSVLPAGLSCACADLEFHV
jgi:hypothetical protein